MGAIKEKVSYIRGLAEGLDINPAKGEGKVILAIIDVLDEMALSIEETDVAVEELYEWVDELSEDMDELCDDLYDDDDDEFDDDDLALISCPKCGETVCYDEDGLDNDGKLLCPSCGGEIATKSIED